MTKVIVGYVRSPEGEAAVSAGIDAARLLDAELLIINSSRGGDGEREDEVVAMWAAGDAIAERLESEGIRYRLAEHVLGNTPSKDLIDLAVAENADLIVLGLRQRSLVGKLILGSTAHEVLMGAPCAVLTIRPDPAVDERVET
ncbi:MAG: universal stress protein [Acidimicrobiia bacterium]